MNQAVQNFEVEHLMHNFKDIQQEKNSLEHKLNEQRRRRRDLEQTLESVTNKLSQIKDVQVKMQETMKIAQHKAAETQVMADSLEAECQKKRLSIVELNNKIDTAKQQQMTDVVRFEDELSGIADKLVQARHYYVDENLNKEIEETSIKRDDLQEKVKSYSHEVNDLDSRFKEMELLKTKDNDSYMEKEIPVEVRKIIWSLLQEENSAHRKVVEDLQNKLEMAKQTAKTLSDDHGVYDS